MKIVEVITFLGSGGAERFIVDLSNELSKGNEVYLLTVLDDKKDAEIRNFYRFAIDSKVHYINLGLPNGLSYSNQVAVKKAIDEIAPDIVHLHLACTLNYCALATLSLAWKYKIYFTIHSDLHNGYDKGFLKIVCNTLGRLGKFKLACLSNKNYADFKAFYPHTSIRCIVNGRAPIEPTECYNEVAEEMNGYRHAVDSKLFVHIARFHPVKNQSLLVESFNELINEGANVDLVVIGANYDCEDGIKLQEKANERIHFIGAHKNISDYILNADIFCLSSDYEGMPITLLEASLAGAPAVSTPVCGAVDLIQNGVNGYISKDHSLAEYKTALLKAMADFEKLKYNAMKMKDNSPYTIAECAKKYIEYFKE